MEKLTAITTVDNPWDPFDEFDKWLRYDMHKEYGTCELLARLAPVSDEYSDELQDALIEAAIDQIILSDPEGKYKKVTKNV